MYPLNLTKKLPEGAGFAVANNEEEHKALSEAGYEPKYEAPETAAKTKPKAE